MSLKSLVVPRSPVVTDNSAEEDGFAGPEELSLSGSLIHGKEIGSTSSLILAHSGEK